MIELSWYVVNTKTGEEDRALENLARQGFRPYLPKYERAQNGKSPRFVALFPGYLFVEFNSRHCPWSKISTTRGVNRLLTASDGRPQPLARAVIDMIMSREVAPSVIAMEPEAYSEFEPGQSVKVTDGGKFLGHDAIFKCHDGWDRVTLLMQMMGGATQMEVTVPRESVR